MCDFNDYVYGLLDDVVDVDINLKLCFGIFESHIDVRWTFLFLLVSYRTFIVKGVYYCLYYKVYTDDYLKDILWMAAAGWTYLSSAISITKRLYPTSNTFQ